MKCVNCGSDNNDGSKFCMKCGNNLESIPNTSQTEVQQPIQNNQELGINNPIKKNKKLIICIILGVLIVGLGTLGITSILKKKDTSSKTKNGEEKKEQPVDTAYIIVKDNDKYGIIDTNGNLIAQVKYTKIIGIYNGYYYGEYVDEESEKHISCIYDIKGNEIIKSNYSYGDYEYNKVDETWIINEKLYDKDLKQISNDNQRITDITDDSYYHFNNETEKTIGYMNKTGKILYQDSTDVIDYVSIEEELNGDTTKSCIIRKKLKETSAYNSGIIDCATGEIIYNFSDTFISSSYGIYNISPNNNSDKIKIIILNNKVAYTLKSNESSTLSTTDNYYTIIDTTKTYFEEGRLKYLNPFTGEITNDRPNIENESTNIKNALEYLNYKSTSCEGEKIDCDGNKTDCQTNDLYKITTKDKEDLTKCIYTHIGTYNLETYKYLESRNTTYFFGERNGVTYLLNAKTGNEEKKFDSTDYEYYRDSAFIKYIDKSNKKVIYNVISGNKVTVADDESFEVYQNYITITKDSITRYYNENLRVIYKTGIN